MSHQYNQYYQFPVLSSSSLRFYAAMCLKKTDYLAKMAQNARSVTPILLTLLCSLSILGSPTWAEAGEESQFFVKPYLQLGRQANDTEKKSCELIWLTKDNGDKWKLKIKQPTSTGDWLTQPVPLITPISAPTACQMFHASISGLKPGVPFKYIVLKNDKPVFDASAVAPKIANQSAHVVLFGDMGADTPAQRKVAKEIFDRKPDLVVMLGDIVYDSGLFSEYLQKFFPVYNCDIASPNLGAPLLRSVISVAAIGNHDNAYKPNPSAVNLDNLPDAMAYFKVWSQPLNGPSKVDLGANMRKLLGSKEHIAQFLSETDGNYPSMSNYSFNYGNAHWLVLDANPYMDWTNATLRKWVANDLSSSKPGQWSFVCLHQPGFSFDASHYKEQRMRLLCDLFEKEHVDVVFCGHAHNYQRSFPLKFKAKTDHGVPVVNSDGTISGELDLDKNFNGKTSTVPKGVLYIVTGAGGARLYGSIQESHPLIEKTFTDKFISDVHSFSLCDINASTFSLSQISEDGKVLDHFIITKQRTPGVKVKSDSKLIQTHSDLSEE